MGTAESTGQRTRYAAGRAVRSPAVRRLARVGLGCRAVLYALIGLLALRIATGTGGQEADKTGAVESIAAQPFGATLLWLMAVGFAAMALWQASVAGFSGHDRRERIEAALRTAVYLLIVGTIGSVLLWGHGGSGGRQGRGGAGAPAGLAPGQGVGAGGGLGGGAAGG